MRLHSALGSGLAFATAAISDVVGTTTPMRRSSLTSRMLHPATATSKFKLRARCGSWFSSVAGLGTRGRSRDGLIMNLPPPKVCKRIYDLFARIGSPNPKEVETARHKLSHLLTKHNLTWNDLPKILATSPINAPHVEVLRRGRQQLIRQRSTYSRWSVNIGARCNESMKTEFGRLCQAL